MVWAQAAAKACYAAMEINLCAAHAPRVMQHRGGEWYEFEWYDAEGASYSTPGARGSKDNTHAI